MFKDRYDAAEKLAAKLESYRNDRGVVLAVPRGGVPLGYIIARALGFPLEVVLSKKIGHPLNSEYAIGSVSLYGTVVDERVSGIPAEYIHKESEKILAGLKAKHKLFMGTRQPVPVEGKTIILVDDGAATGNTIIASIEALKKKNPARIIIAIPVAPVQTAEKLSSISDELICLVVARDFYGVGQFYHDFHQVSDDEAIRLLDEANNNRKVA